MILSSQNVYFGKYFYFHNSLLIPAYYIFTKRLLYMVKFKKFMCVFMLRTYHLCETKGIHLEITDFAFYSTKKSVIDYPKCLISVVIQKNHFLAKL